MVQGTDRIYSLILHMIIHSARERFLAPHIDKHCLHKLIISVQIGGGDGVRDNFAQGQIYSYSKDTP